MTSLATLGNRLRSHVGLDVDALGPHALAHAVRSRARDRALDERAYLDVLADDPEEWQALVEALLVPETWFFRDRAPFALLTRWVTHVWAGRDGRDPVAVLSLPCSTGEEAWSIAITLAAAGLTPAAFRVDAADLSERALAVARGGRYRPRALRGGALDPAWARHLQHQPGGHIEVAPELRPSVNFQRANLVEARRVFAGRRFDCVFCRNLLIYCANETRSAAAATFAALLQPDGLLVLGHADTLPPGTADFVREHPTSAFAWRRVAPPPPCHPIAPADAIAGGASLRARVARHPRPSSVPIPSTGSQARPSSVDPPGGGSKADRQITAQSRTRNVEPGALSATADLAHARDLADRGRLEEAAAIAAARVTAAPDDAVAHALLGVVRAAQGRDREATDHLRRALYLDPVHEDALVHLALLLERQGDAAGAARLRARARRLEVTL